MKPRDFGAVAAGARDGFSSDAKAMDPMPQAERLRKDRREARVWRRSWILIVIPFSAA